MVPLFSAEGLSSLVFIFIVMTTVLGAVIATHSERLIRAVTGLAICFIGVAGLYYYLNSPFVALMETSSFSCGSGKGFEKQASAPFSFIFLNLSSSR